MSTIVGLTGGATCNDVGITIGDCNTERTSVSANMSRLKKPGMRNNLMKAFETGKTNQISNRTLKPWNSGVSKHQNSAGDLNRSKSRKSNE